VRKVRVVLIVDDNPADLDLAREALHDRAPRTRIDTAVDGEDAMESLRGKGIYTEAACPDLVILDLNLPGKDGRTVLAELKTDPGLRQIPVVIFSTSSLSQDVSGCYALGANCYVTKPGNLKDYRAALQSIEEFWIGVSTLPEGKV